MLLINFVKFGKIKGKPYICSGSNSTIREKSRTAILLCCHRGAPPKDVAKIIQFVVMTKQLGNFLSIINKTKCIMDKKERFSVAYEHLRHKGVIKTQQDLADRLGSTSQNIGQALRGNPKVLTFLAAYPDIFSMSWMFTGKGTMLLNDPQPKQSAHTYTLPEQVPDMAANSAPLSDRDLLAATYAELIRLSDSFHAYQSRTESKLRELESLLAPLAPSSPSSSPSSPPNVSPNSSTANQKNDIT